MIFKNLAKGGGRNFVGPIFPGFGWRQAGAGPKLRYLAPDSQMHISLLAYVEKCRGERERVLGILKDGDNGRTALQRLADLQDEQGNI